MPEFKTQNAILLAIRSLGERSHVLSVFTEQNGKCSGVIKAKKAPDIGSLITGRWQARLTEQLGQFYLDDIQFFSVDFLDDHLRLSVLSSVCTLLNSVLPEHQSYPDLYQQTILLFQQMNEPTILAKYLKWEVNVLRAIGFGLDFSDCAGGGNKNDLAFISPKSGRAVSREKGEPYKEKLLPLPYFLWKKDISQEIPLSEIHKGFTLTTYFFTTHAGIRHMPLMREQLIRHIYKKIISD